MKLISGILVFLISLNICAEAVSFSINRYLIRKEAKNIIEEGLKKGEIETIKINQNDIPPSFQMIHEKEFKFKGNIYDIIDQKISGNFVIYRCINDTKEKFLINNLLNKNGFNHKISSIFNLNLIKSLLMTYLPLEAIALKNYKNILYYVKNIQLKISSLKPEIPSPPPKLFITVF